MMLAGPFFTDHSKVFPLLQLFLVRGLVVSYVGFVLLLHVAHVFFRCL